MCQLSDTAHPTPHSSRNWLWSWSFCIAWLRPTSASPLSDFLGVSLKPCICKYQPSYTWLHPRQVSTLDWRPLQKDNLPSSCPFLTLWAGGSFPAFCWDPKQFSSFHGTNHLGRWSLLHVWTLTLDSLTRESEARFGHYFLKWGHFKVGNKQTVHWPPCIYDLHVLLGAHNCGFSITLRHPHREKNVKALNQVTN